jgi:hypothetical protein
MALPIHLALAPEGVNLDMSQLTRVSAAPSKQVDVRGDQRSCLAGNRIRHVGGTRQGTPRRTPELCVVRR